MKITEINTWYKINMDEFRKAFNIPSNQDVEFLIIEEDLDKQRYISLRLNNSFNPKKKVKR